jgi:arylsulfatase A-like enzyme
MLRSITRFLPSLVLGALCSLPALAQVSPATRPNIVFILADDLGYAELGSYGQKVIQTPHLDQLAREGLRFTQFYAGATVCGPSRSVLMTGQHQGHTRVRGNSLDPLKVSLLDEDVTVARTLQSGGYRTAIFGKWGLGEAVTAESGLPRRQGFDAFFGFLNHHHAHNHYPSFLWRNEEKILLPNVTTPVGDSGAGVTENPILYADDLVTDEVLKWIGQNQAHPFFIYWNPVLPHANNEKNNLLKNGTEVPDYGPYAQMDWPDQDKGQAAMITRLDSYVGRLVTTLRLLGLDRNTLIVFTSDNGPHNEAHHNLARFQPAQPFSGIKRDLTDGGIRVPCIAWWPGRIAAGTVSNHVAYFGDWFATATDLTGLTPPAGLDSISFAPTLLNQPGQQEHDYLYWEFHEKGFHQAALYQGRWKAIRLGRADAPLAIYDQLTDVAEKNDLAAKRPDLVAQFEAYFKTARTPAANWPTAR